MKTIFKNGKIQDVPFFLNDNDEFGIQELDDLRASDRIAYQGDGIKYELDNELVGLCDLFRDLLFEDVDQYYKELSSMPIWVQKAGQSSGIAISSDMFTELMDNAAIPNLFKHLYLVDCQFLVGTVQNLLCAMESAFVSYYQLLSCFPIDGDYRDLTDENRTIIVLSSYSIQASSAVETYFTKAYSILDIMTKICYEIQFLRNDFPGYQKLKSADVLWGSKKKLDINETEGTIFEKCELISNVESIRNEIVHNGTWELTPKIFIRFNNGEEAERFMLFPDMEQGHLSTVKNRRHFFSGNVKMNDIFPEIHLEFKNRLMNTIYEIKKNVVTLKNK